MIAERLTLSPEKEKAIRLVMRLTDQESAKLLSAYESLPDRERRCDRMKILSDRAIEQRARRALAKYGYQLHKSRKKDGGYFVTGGDEATAAWVGDADALIDAVERLKERSAQ